MEKKFEITINNEINNNNNIINNDNNINIINNQQINDEILCFELYEQFIICGHKSGKLSTWKPNNNTYLQKQGDQNICESSINKILLTKLSDNRDYLILCCGDKTLKIFSFEGFQVINSLNYEDEIIDIKLANNFDNESVFIISLKNGLLKVLNQNLETIFDISSRFKINKTRKIITMKNLSKDNLKGDYVLITEGNLIDIYQWIKLGSFTPNSQSGPKNNNNNYSNNNNNYFPHHPHQGFYGPHFPPKNYHRGGKY